MSDEMILVPRYELLAWAEEWQYENDPGDGTDCITPFDTYLLKSPVVAQPDEHVEVLRGLTEVCRAAIKAGDWKVDGACDPDSLLQHAAAAIASLSATQPPAEAVGTVLGGEFHYLRVNHGLPDGTMLYSIDQAQGDAFCDGHCTWLDHAPGCPRYEDAPPSTTEAQPVYVGVDLEGGWIRATAPVGVAADILRIVDTAIDVCNDRDRPAMAEDLEAVRLYVEQASAPLAQQPAAVDEAQAALREAAENCLPFVAYAFDQGIAGAEEAGRELEAALDAQQGGES